MIGATTNVCNFYNVVKGGLPVPPISFFVIKLHVLVYILAILFKLITSDVLTSTRITRKSLQTFYRNSMNISKLVVPEISCTNVSSTQGSGCVSLRTLSLKVFKSMQNRYYQTS